MVAKIMEKKRRRICRFVQFLDTEVGEKGRL
ncbi:hypothetical protein Pan216_20150 [Planctomycetes bacterium Pan216]|uniref:Uncharacterized protein n=1 Tax=Kolteria novifilia TaxID=2527975 RepID=A0A518B2D9_9BACT|nr:hypothetical protein Pan216_20150 [Planctomycetes bacterium Pan216]